RRGGHRRRQAGRGDVGVARLGGRRGLAPGPVGAVALLGGAGPGGRLPGEGGGGQGAVAGGPGGEGGGLGGRGGAVGLEGLAAQLIRGGGRVGGGGPGGRQRLAARGRPLPRGGGGEGAARRGPGDGGGAQEAHLLGGRLDGHPGALLVGEGLADGRH